MKHNTVLPDYSVQVINTRGGPRVRVVCYLKRASHLTCHWESKCHTDKKDALSEWSDHCDSVHEGT